MRPPFQIGDIVESIYHFPNETPRANHGIVVRVGDYWVDIDWSYGWPAFQRASTDNPDGLDRVISSYESNWTTKELGYHSATKKIGHANKADRTFYITRYQKRYSSWWK